MCWIPAKFLICIPIFLYFSLQVISISQATSFKAGFERLHISLLIRLYNKYLRNKSSQDRTTQAPDCDNCARLRHQNSDLEAELAKAKSDSTNFGNGIQSDMHKLRAELQIELDEANAKVEQSGHFLREAEALANHQRTEVHSLREELRLARSDNSADFQRNLAVQQDLEKLRQQNAQLTNANLQQVEHTMQHKQHTLRAERDLDNLADKIRTMVHDRNALCCELDKMRTQLLRQERRASGQREGRIRAEVEMEELRRPRTILWQGREVMFT
ncbi:hypothetical protein F4801DRAFT_497118 [Xylaria longipes]|nr:hypothetical protein F4801DRAFT_497118 [Xylaria longipes]RYC63745.1 hypothetical protein CHU98_g2474 [Xylaria longipes]